MIRFKSLGKLLLITTVITALTIGGAAAAYNGKQGKGDNHIQQASPSKKKEHDKKSQDNKQITKVSNALAISSIVKHLGLNLDEIHVVNAPKATDYFPNMKNDAWYSNAFVVAHLNGLDLSANINPSGVVTREQFSHWLYQALSTTGDYSWTEIYIEVIDNSSIKSEYQNSIQKLLIAGIVKLDSKQQFHPAKNVSYGEVMSMLHSTKQFIKKNADSTPTPEPLQVSLSTEKVTDQVKKVLLSAEVGHPGYGLEITNIAFKDNKAYITYKVIQPDPNMMYPQVISTVTATTFIPTSYEAVIVTESAQNHNRR